MPAHLAAPCSLRGGAAAPSPLPEAGLPRPLQVPWTSCLSTAVPVLLSRCAGPVNLCPLHRDADLGLGGSLCSWGGALGAWSQNPLSCNPGLGQATGTVPWEVLVTCVQTQKHTFTLVAPQKDWPWSHKCRPPKGQEREGAQHRTGERVPVRATPGATGRPPRSLGGSAESFLTDPAKGQGGRALRPLFLCGRSPPRPGVWA